MAILARKPPSKEELWHWYHYDPGTGVLSWANPRSPAFVGRAILVEGTKVPEVGTCKVTHVIWKMMTGEDVPDHQTVDHRDLDDTNNRWDNLRLASSGQNNQNRDGWSRAGLPKGIVLRASNRYAARGKDNGRDVWIGTFKTLEEAVAARRAYAMEHYGEFARE